MRLGDGLLSSSFVHEHSLVPFVDFAVAVAVGTSGPVAVDAGHTEVAAAVSIAVVAAVVEVAIVVAVAGCIAVVAGDMAAAEGLHMVVAGCLVVHHGHQPYWVASGLRYSLYDMEQHLEELTCLLVGGLNYKTLRMLTWKRQLLLFVVAVVDELTGIVVVWDGHG